MSLLGYVRERREACVRLHRVLSATAFLLVLVLPRFAKKRGVWFPAADGRDDGSLPTLGQGLRTAADHHRRDAPGRFRMLDVASR